MVLDNEEEGRAESNIKVTRRGNTTLFLPLCRANARGTARKEEKAKNEISRIACVANGVIPFPPFSRQRTSTGLSFGGYNDWMDEGGGEVSPEREAKRGRTGEHLSHAPQGPPFWYASGV
jgi:hypothetical protein